MSLKPSAYRVLLALRDGPRTTAQLCLPSCGGTRFSARIHELRAAGAVIEEKRVRPGSSTYRLLSEPRTYGEQRGEGQREARDRPQRSTPAESDALPLAARLFEPTVPHDRDVAA